MLKKKHPPMVQAVFFQIKVTCPKSGDCDMIVVGNVM